MRASLIEQQKVISQQSFVPRLAKAQKLTRIKSLIAANNPPIQPKKINKLKVINANFDNRKLQKNKNFIIKQINSRVTEGNSALSQYSQNNKQKSLIRTVSQNDQEFITMSQERNLGGFRSARNNKQSLSIPGRKIISNPSDIASQKNTYILNINQHKIGQERKSQPTQPPQLILNVPNQDKAKVSQIQKPQLIQQQLQPNSYMPVSARVAPNQLQTISTSQSYSFEQVEGNKGEIKSQRKRRLNASNAANNSGQRQQILSKLASQEGYFSQRSASQSKLNQKQQNQKGDYQEPQIIPINQMYSARSLKSLRPSTAHHKKGRSQQRPHKESPECDYTDLKQKKYSLQDSNNRDSSSSSLINQGDVNFLKQMNKDSSRNIMSDKTQAQQFESIQDNKDPNYFQLQNMIRSSSHKKIDNANPKFTQINFHKRKVAHQGQSQDNSKKRVILTNNEQFIINDLKQFQRAKNKESNIEHQESSRKELLPQQVITQHYFNTQDRFNKDLQYSTETPNKSYLNQGFISGRKQFKEDSTQSLSQVSSSNKSKQADISSTGGSNSQFLSKLRLKKVNSRNQNQYIQMSANQILITSQQSLFLNRQKEQFQTQVSQPESCEQSSQQLYQGSFPNYLFNQRERLSLQQQHYINQQRQQQSNSHIRFATNQSSYQSSQNAQQLLPYSPSVVGSIITDNSQRNKSNNSAQIRQSQQSPLNIGQRQPQFDSNQHSNAYINQIPQKPSDEYFQMPEVEKADINIQNNRFNKVSKKKIPTQEEMLILIKEQQKYIRDQEKQLQQFQQQLKPIISQGNISSLDLSNIEKGTQKSIKGLGGIDLSESYITKIDDTTNEDFKEILNMITDDKNTESKTSLKYE